MGSTCKQTSIEERGREGGGEGRREGGREGEREGGGGRGREGGRERERLSLKRLHLRPRCIIIT